MATYRLTGTAVVIRIADGASIPADPANRDYAAYLAWKAAGGVPDPYHPPDESFAGLPPTLIAAALNINVSDGDITSIDGMFNLVGGSYIDVGTYYLFFATQQPDDNYFAIITGNAPAKQMTTKTTDFFVIETFVAIGGAHVDPPQTSVQIYRIAT
jgi:hypothetical protein